LERKAGDAGCPDCSRDVGAALVEVVFSWPGVGSLMLNAVLSRDYPLLSGIFIFVSIIIIVCNLLADIVYAKLDPRIVY